MNLSEAILWGEDQLKEHGVDDPRIEAEILLCHALNLKPSDLIAHSDKEITKKRSYLFKSYILRRSRHEPTAYITGYQPFMSLNFFVDDNVLIPRPETELLAETTIKEIQKKSIVNYPWSIVDIGTGSGVIAICLAKRLKNVKIKAIDSSSAALKIARKNAKLHSVTKRIDFARGNFLDPVKDKVDLIISNPPYIPSKNISKLQPEVREWEPRSALDGGRDGLIYINKLIKGSPSRLKPGGTLIFEFGFKQAVPIKKLIQEAGVYSSFNVIKDYSGIERILLARRI